MAGETYPKRPRLFVLEFMRTLERSGAVYDLGTDGVWLLLQVVLTEDRVRYARPVRYTNEMLMDRAGWSRARLVRVRDLCVEHGWLLYESGAKGRAGTYWVRVPSGVPNEDDAQIPSTGAPESRRNLDGIKTECGQNPDRIRTESGQNPDGIPTESKHQTFLDPKSLDPGPLFPERDRAHSTFEFEAWFAAYPRRTGRRAAAEAWHAAIAHLVADGSVDRDGAIAKLQADVEEFASSPKGRGQYVPDPAKWLAEGRYDDDRDSWRDSGAKGRPKSRGESYVDSGGIAEF